MNGMDDNEDEHNFSDDDLDFDTIPDTTLRELEHNAILSTQRPLETELARPIRGAVGKGTNVPTAQHHTRTVPSRLITQVPSHGRVQTLAAEELDDESFEYLANDGVRTPVEEKQSEIAPVRIPGESTQREQWRQERFSNLPARSETRPQQSRTPHYQIVQRTQQQNGHRESADGRHARPLQQLTAAAKSQEHVASDAGLRIKVEELMRERDKLTQDLASTKKELWSREGQITVNRNRHAEDKKLLERQYAALQKKLQEETERQKASLAALAKKNEDLITAHQFTKIDLAQALEKTTTLQQRLKERPTERAADAATPNKRPANSLRDGFDDDEIMLVSPIKSARRSKPTTPTAAGKRKRKIDVQSPIRPLVLQQSGNEGDGPHQPLPQTSVNASRIVPIMRRDPQAERNLKFVQQILDYHVKDGKQPLIEVLMRYSFPSDTSKTFTSIVLDATARLKGKRLPADLLQVFIDLWAKSLKEKYYNCIALLLETVDYIIDLDMSVVDKGTVTILLPVLQDSTTINAMKRFEHSPVSHAAYGQFRQTPQSALVSEVDGTKCLQMLYKVACIVQDDYPLLDLFWRSMSTDFVLMMLNAWQPTADITLIFHLLATSIFPTTFGNICPDDVQMRMESYIVDRVCYLLWETPKVDEGLKPHSRAEICTFRLEAMQLLTTLAVTSSIPPYDDPDHHGSQLIAGHPSAIARIVRSLYDEVNAMYLMSSCHELHAELVNRGVYVLYHVLKVHGNNIDMQKKLSAVNGMVHKHRVVLTRLAFSEGFQLDRLITDETVAMATHMLEESVTPDEADQLIEAFPSFKGRKASQE